MVAQHHVKQGVKIGTTIKDGTIFAGISPDTGKYMYAAPADAGVSMPFKQAARYAKNLTVGGKKGFHVPTRGELKVLFDNRSKGGLKGTFNLTGSDLAGWYWSSTRGYEDGCVHGQQFKSGRQGLIHRSNDSSVRCVR